MAATINIPGDLYARLWAILLAHAPVADAVKPANRVGYGAPAVLPRPNAMPADFPELMLVDGERADGGIFGPDRRPTFAAFDPALIAGTADWVEEFTQEMIVTLTHRDERMATAAALEAEVEKAIRLAGRTLGLPYVHGWTIRTRPQITAKGRARNTTRRVTTITLRVQIQANGRTLV